MGSLKEPKNLRCELFCQNILVFYHWSAVDFVRYMKKHYSAFNEDLSGDAGYCNSFDNVESGTDFVIWVGKKEGHSFLIHELIHLKNMIFKHVDHKLDVNNDEFEAYYTQRIYKFITDEE